MTYKLKRYSCWLLPLLILITPVSYAIPAIYLFLGSEPARNYKPLLENRNVKGAQIIYSWKTLEPRKNIYNFEPIRKDLQFLESLHKSLFIQIQDKSFHPEIIPIPHYLLSKKYEKGAAKQIDFPGEGKSLSTGWVAKQWVPSVQERFQKLLITLAKHFDGKIKGINLTETAIDLDGKQPSSHFICNRYFNSIMGNLKVLRSAFHKSDVVQYVNFFPCEWNNDHHYMSRLFAFSAKNNIGLGGPDVVPYRQGQMKNSYPFFHHYKNKLSLIAFAIQEPDYTYKNPKTGKYFTAEELYEFAKNYLGATILFWNIQQPQYSKYVVPLLNK